MNVIKYNKITENLKFEKSKKNAGIKNNIKKVFLILTLAIAFTSQILGTETFAAYYKNDITPPWGRIYVEKSAKVDGTTYVGETPVSVKIYAKDDMCKDEEIKYYISTEQISTTTKLNTWYDYEEGKTHEINLNDDGTGKVYTIFKDANGNTSLTYEANVNTMQTVIFDANGGEAVPTEVNTKRIYGTPYILPVQEPYKRGEYFLGWSTDKNATVGSFRQGEAIPADMSLGTEESVTLYAIYGTDVSKFPDLVDVVEIGDYVNYPVYYENVISYVEADGAVHNETISSMNGWRVLNKDKETGIIELVSSGIPLSLYENNDENTVEGLISNLTSPENFLKIPFSSVVTDEKFFENGFIIYNSLLDAFNNKYTVINSDVPEVRAMTMEDANKVYQYFSKTSDTITDDVVLDKKIYKEMLSIPALNGNVGIYLLASNVRDEKMLDLFSNQRTNLYKATVGVRPVVTLKPNIKATGKDIEGAWNIETYEKAVQKPIATSVKYTGEEQTVPLKYDSRYIEISGTTIAKDIGSYTAMASIKDTSKYIWVDGTTEDKEIVWEIEDINYGDFIEYGVDYTDVVTSYNYSGDEGWRILSKTESGDGTFNIEIISSGLPAFLYYGGEYIDSSTWVASSSQITQYENNYYIGSSTSNANVKAAAGLLYNFEKILFSKGTGWPERNEAIYTKISGNQNTSTGLFKASNLSNKTIKVRSVMHTDLKPESAKNDIGVGYSYVERAKGIFVLENLDIDKHTSGSYWLASPDTSRPYNLRAVWAKGNISDEQTNTYGYRYGVRPVVSISNVNVIYEDGMWKIK